MFETSRDLETLIIIVVGLGEFFGPRAVQIRVSDIRDDTHRFGVLEKE